MAQERKQVNMHISTLENKKGTTVKSVYIPVDLYPKLKADARSQKREVGNLILFLLIQDARNREIKINDSDERSGINTAHDMWERERPPRKDDSGNDVPEPRSFNAYTNSLVQGYLDALKKNKK